MMKNRTELKMTTHKENCSAESDEHSVSGTVRNGLCTRHYMRNWRNGDPLAGRTARGVVERYFNDSINIETENCIEWMYANVEGYGIFKRNKRVTREVLRLKVGNAPQGKNLALHTCDNPPCFNYKHLFWGSNSDNGKDMATKGRSHRGSKHHLSKLSEKDVLGIRVSVGTQTCLARRYGVSQTTVYNIKNRRTWKWL